MTAACPAWAAGRGPRLLIADGWYANAGDGAIALAMARSIARVLPGARMLFCAPHRQLVQGHYPSLPLADPLHVLIDQRPELVAQADAVVSQGGGFLFEHYGVARRVAAYAAVADLGIPMAFWAQSVGWFEDLGLRADLRRAVESARLFCARDPETVEQLRAMGVRGAVRLSADEALMLPVRATGTAGHGFGIALNCLAEALPGAPAQPPRAGAAERHAEIVERLTREGPVRACSTVQGLGPLSNEVEDDLPHHHEIGGLLPEHAREQYEVVGGFLGPGALRRQLRSLDVVVSARMHVAILAMLEGVPAVYASSNFKGTSLFRRLGLEDLVVPDADPGAVLHAVGVARTRRSSLSSRLARLRREVRPTADAVLRSLGLLR